MLLGTGLWLPGRYGNGGGGGGGGSFGVKGVTLDGSTRLIYSAATLLASDNPNCTIGMWIRGDTTPVGEHCLFEATDGTSKYLVTQNAGNIALDIYNGSSFYHVVAGHPTDSNALYDGAWHFIGINTNMNLAAGSKVGNIVIDNINATAWTHTDVSAAFTVPWSSFTSVCIGGEVANDTDRFFTGDIAEVIVNPGTNMNMSNADNRAKFITVDGAPVDVGADGSGPFASAPELYLSVRQPDGVAADFLTNRGVNTSATFSVDIGSAPTLSSTNPGA